MLPVYILLIFAFLPLVIGTLAVLCCGRRSGGFDQCPALLLHSAPERRIPGLSHTRADVCRKLLRQLSLSGYSTLTVQEVCAGQALPARATKVVALTFDDGFEDFYNVVFPELAKHGMRATVFPIVDYIGRRSTWDIFPSLSHLSGAQIHEIASAGHEIGGHTLTHPDLLLLPTREVRRELAESKKALEDMISGPVVTVSFPYGRWNGRIWRVAQECGYKYATVYGNHTPDGNSFVHVHGVYSFDTLEDIMEKIERQSPVSNSLARSRIMPHFAKGSPIWRFRKTYRVFQASR